MQGMSLELITKEINETVIHRSCVMRSGVYLANYLSAHNRSLDALELIRRCAIHDVSKFSNTQEFMHLASIVEEIEEMNDVTHTLKPHQVEAIHLHWEGNSHHPENFNSPNDMTDNDLQEMAVDCHARSKLCQTDLLEYIDKQQELRFHFDSEHYKTLRNYCFILVEMTKNDSYKDLLNPRVKNQFSFKDSTLHALENFNETVYPKVVETERLSLIRRSAVGLGMICYELRLKTTNEQIGEVRLKCNGFFEHKIYEGFAEEKYASEAIRKITDISKLHVFRLLVNKENINQAQLAVDLGFVKEEVHDDSFVYKLKKKSKRV